MFIITVMISCETSSEFQTKEGILMNSLLQFFSNPEYKQIIVPILTDSVPISLRILDYFITNYSRDNTKIIVNDPILRDFNVYSSYKSQLKAFNKKLFDPFCRMHNQGKIKKFKLYYTDTKYITTTTGQLNFFKWAIENRIIDYVVEHYNEIKSDLKLKESEKKGRSSTNSSSFSDYSRDETSSDTSSERMWSNKKVYVISFN